MEPNPELHWMKNPPEAMVRTAGVYVATDRSEDVARSVREFWRTSGGQETAGDAWSVAESAWKSDGLLGCVVLPAQKDAKGQAWTSVYDSAPKRGVIWRWGDSLAKHLHRELGVPALWYNIGPKTKLDTSTEAGSFGSAGVVRGTRESWKVMFELVKQLPFPFFRLPEVTLYESTLHEQTQSFVVKFEPAKLPSF